MSLILSSVRGLCFSGQGNGTAKQYFSPQQRQKLKLMEALTLSDELTRHAEAIGQKQEKPSAGLLSRVLSLFRLPHTLAEQTHFDADTLRRLQPTAQIEFLKGLATSLAASASATLYKPEAVILNGQRIAVHHPHVLPLLKQAYTPRDIDHITAKLDAMGVFHFPTDAKTGLMTTTLSDHNQAMNHRWHTDSMYHGDLQMFYAPEHFPKNLLTNAATFQTPWAQAAFDRVDRDPDWYRQGNAMTGVPHIYAPWTVEMDEKTGIPKLDKLKNDEGWFNHKRIESQALVLSHLVKGLDDGFRHKAPYGLQPAFLATGQRQATVAKSIADLANYLVNIHTNPAAKPDDPARFDYKAPSASSWEETPFPQMTSDIGDTVLAFERYRDLMFPSRDSASPQLDPLRTAVRANLNGKRSEAVLNDKAQLEAFIQAGRAIIQAKVVERLAQGKTPMQSDQRKADTSLVLLAASDYRFDPSDLVKDAQIRYAIVNKVAEKLQDANGMKRYGVFRLFRERTQSFVRLWDSYINLNFWAPEPLRRLMIKSGHLRNTQPLEGDKFYRDTTDVEGFYLRQQGTGEDYAASWSIGTTAALKAIAKAHLDMSHALAQQKTVSPEAKTAFTEIDKGLNEYITRSLALVYGQYEGQLPINSAGEKSPQNTIIEAMEYVTDLNGQPRAIPGAHPLAWSVAQLRMGLHLAKLAKQHAPI